MNKRNKGRLTRLLALVILNAGVVFTAWSQSVWNICSGNTYEYAYCSINPTAANCNACTLSYIGGDASGYVITRGDFNGAYTTTINWLKAGTYTLHYSCDVANGRTVTVGQAEIRYPVTGAGILCGGSKTIRLTNSESLVYALRKNNTIYGSPKSGSPGTALEWNVTETGTYDVVAMYGCTQSKTTQPAVIGSATITAANTYNVGGGGISCTGGSGVSITLAGSQAGINYELYKDDAFIAQSTRAGTGNQLIWNNLTFAGTYTIKAVGDCATRWSMNGQATITNNSPAIFNVGGGGAYCSGGAPLSITLSGSQTGLSYQLKKDGANTGAPLGGTGNALTWPNQTAAGTFTVTSYNNSCNVSMNGSVAVTVQPLSAGATMSNAIDLGSNLSCITYNDQKTIGSAHCFASDYGAGGDDVFYKFTASYAVALTASHCGSAFNTLLYVLSGTGGIVASRNIDASTACQEQNKLQAALPPGTYYIISKAATAADQGTLATQINLVMTEDLYLSPANTTIHEEQPVVLTAPDAMTSVHEWLPADNTIETTTARSATVRPGTTTTYTARGTINGCAATAKATVVVQADNSNSNYVKETIVKTSGIRALSDLHNLSTDQKSVNTNYFDGLGRNKQTVSWQASPGRKDVVQPVVYDRYGREPIRYMPYTSNSGSGQYKINPVGTPTTYNASAHHAFYNAGNDGVANDEQPYAQTIFDASPLNEVVKHGAPGAAWQPDGSPSGLTDKTIKKQYANNLDNEVFHFIYNTAAGSVSLSANKYYSAGQLAVNIVIDEQAHEVREYIDKEGKVILRKVEYSAAITGKLYACTYYIYNDIGDLSIVLPPESIKMLTDCSN